MADERKRDFSVFVNSVNKIIAGIKPVATEWYKDDLSATEVCDGIIRDSFRKFVEPDPLLEEGRKQTAIDRYFSDNCRIGSHELRIDSELADFVRKFIHRAIGRDRLLDRDAWFGPGESFYSAYGQTSAFSKLARSVQYTVTADAVKHIGAVLLRNAQFIGYLSDDAISRGVINPCEDEETWATHLIDSFRSKITLVHGNRISSVPKNAQVDRDIGVEPLLNMMYQKQIGALLRRANYRMNNCLSTGQLRHQKLIKKPLCTIDLKSASNSNSMVAVELLFPRWLVDHIHDSRAAYSKHSEGRWYKNHIVSSMGNGFTFELMSLLLLAVCRFFDPHASVYGDDIIVDPTVSNLVVRSLTGLGYIVNEQKSFFNGDVRESCGAFYVGKTRVPRYDIKYCENIVDCIVVRNKIFRLYQYCKEPQYGVTRDLVSRLRKLNRQLTALLKKAGIPFGRYFDWSYDLEDAQRDQMLAVYLECRHEIERNAHPNPKIEAFRENLREKLHKPIFAVASWQFKPSKKTIRDVKTREGHIAIWCSLKGSGIPDISRRGAGRIQKCIVFYSNDGIVEIQSNSRFIPRKRKARNASRVKS